MKLTLHPQELQSAMALWRDAASVPGLSSSRRELRNRLDHLLSLDRILCGYLMALQACTARATDHSALQCLIDEVRDSKEWAREGGQALVLMLEMAETRPR